MIKDSKFVKDSIEVHRKQVLKNGSRLKFVRRRREVSRRNLYNRFRINRPRSKSTGEQQGEELQRCVWSLLFFFSSFFSFLSPLRRNATRTRLHSHRLDAFQTWRCTAHTRAPRRSIPYQHSTLLNVSSRTPSSLLP